MGKLVVPTVFINVELIRHLAFGYDENIRVIRALDGSVLIDITREFFAKVFGLHVAPSKVISLSSFKKKYEQDRSSFRVQYLPRFE